MSKLTPVKLIDPPSYITLDNLIAFLEGYQPKGAYPYDDYHACVIAHWVMKETGGYEPSIVNKDDLVVILPGNEIFDLPNWVIDIASRMPHTYKAALERALELRRLKQQEADIETLDEEIEAEASR